VFAHVIVTTISSTQWFLTLYTVYYRIPTYGFKTNSALGYNTIQPQQQQKHNNIIIVTYRCCTYRDEVSRGYDDDDGDDDYVNNNDLIACLSFIIIIIIRLYNNYYNNSHFFLSFSNLHHQSGFSHGRSRGRVREPAGGVGHLFPAPLADGG